jgi:hypothetical protein
LPNGASRPLHLAGQRTTCSACTASRRGRCRTIEGSPATTKPD